MRINLSYNLSAFHAAARFIWENNPSVTKWPSAPVSVFDVMNCIHRDMERYARSNGELILEERATNTDLSSRWTTYSGTGGYFLMFDLLVNEPEEITVEVQILVDPSLGDPSTRYVTEELYDSSELDEQVEPV